MFAQTCLSEHLGTLLYSYFKHSGELKYAKGLNFDTKEHLFNEGATLIKY